MNTLKLGQKSPWNRLAFWLTLFSFTLFHPLVSGAAPLGSGSTWTASTSIPCNATQYRSSVSFYLSSSDFSYTLEADPSTQVLTFTLEAIGTASLPPSEVIATITLSDPSDTCTETFRVTTNSGGGLIMIDNIDL